MYENWKFHFSRKPNDTTRSTILYKISGETTQKHYHLYQYHSQLIINYFFDITDYELPTFFFVDITNNDIVRVVIYIHWELNRCVHHNIIVVYVYVDVVLFSISTHLDI